MAGTYQLNGDERTVIRINADSAFDFVAMWRNPYLLPFDHPGENFFVTKGKWVRSPRGPLFLTSQTDSIIYPIVKKEVLTGIDTAESQFTFYDMYHDTILILYVQFPDSSVRAALHHSMHYFSEDLRKKDTLQFHFYGFRAWTFISDQKKNSNYAITLIPEFRPNVFKERGFWVKRSRLVDIKAKAKFIKTKKR